MVLFAIMATCGAVIRVSPASQLSCVSLSASVMFAVLPVAGSASLSRASSAPWSAIVKLKPSGSSTVME